MRWRVLIVLTAVLSFSTGCEQTPTGVGADQAVLDQDPVASHGQPGKLLTVRGEFIGGATGQTLAPGFPVTRDLFEGRCSVPSDWVIGFQAAGNLPHIGKATSFVSHCSQVDLATGTATYSDGILTIVAANGDEIWGTYHSGTSGPLSATRVWWQDTFVFDGGTGRFVKAAGGGTEGGTFDTDSGILEYELEGTISYDASDRSAR